MATIKKGKAAQPEERLLTQITVNKKQLTVKLWNTKLERMETITFDEEETKRIDVRLSNPFNEITTE